MIVVLFGQPGSGKTTIADQLESFIKVDGDELRKIFNNKDYSKEGRLKNLNRASDIAVFLDEEYTNNVCMSLVYPYKEARDYLNKMSKDVKWVYLTYDDDRNKEQFQVGDFEIPSNEKVLVLNTSNLTISYSVSEILNYLKL